jgi:predicted oxidoreductase (fatty acid repression mutant protein)
MDCNVLQAFSKRHSFYNINNKLDLSEHDVEELIRGCLELYPSSFNSQDARLILLMGEHHTYFWELVKKELFRVSEITKKEQIEQKIASFEAGFGTILFFIDPQIASNLAKNYPQYAPNFPVWAEHSNAMLQFMIWTSFAQKNIGASLQHYNPLIDNIIKQQFKINQDWKLVAQMPFGGVVEEPKAHEVKYINESLIVRP